MACFEQVETRSMERGRRLGLDRPARADQPDLDRASLWRKRAGD
jgi:hypothetical protein